MHLSLFLLIMNTKTKKAHLIVSYTIYYIKQVVNYYKMFPEISFYSNSKQLYFIIVYLHFLDTFSLIFLRNFITSQKIFVIQPSDQISLITYSIQYYNLVFFLNTGPHIWVKESYSGSFYEILSYPVCVTTKTSTQPSFIYIHIIINSG